jgi:hypothetical protein
MGEFWGITFEGKHIRAGEGYLPAPMVRSAKAAIDRGGIVSFTGDIWCEPAEKTPLGYAFRPYDRMPRGAADPLMQMAIAAGIVEAPTAALPAPTPRGNDAEIDPETGEVIEAEKRPEAA